jgi:hypothetical protein
MTKGTRKLWKCPQCPQTSSRRWNVEVHIKRWHDGIGHPIETTSSSASSIADMQLAPNVNSTEIGKNVYPGPSYNRRYLEVNQNINRVEKEPISSTGSSENFKKILYEDNEILRLLAERQDHVRRLSPSLSQQSMISLLPPQLLPNIFQTNIIWGSDRLPTGYRVRFCNRCLDGNMWEPVFTSTQTEALSKEMVGHYCMPEAIAALDQKQNKVDLMRRVQGELFSLLLYIVSLRICLKGTRDEADLKCQELNNEFLMQYPRSTLPIGTMNRTWKKPEEFIDLGPIIDHAEHNDVNREKHWVTRAAEKEAQDHEKIIKIDMNELKEFLEIAKATYGVFRVRIGDDGPVRCFLMSISF